MLIACAPDRDYVEISGVLLASVVANSGLDEIEFAIFGYKLSAEDEARLTACVGDNKITFYDVSDRLESRLADIPKGHWPPAAWARLVASELLGDRGGRMLYLDGDTLVVRSIAELDCMDMRGSPLAAARGDRGGPHTSRLGLDDTYAYFNSGVMLLDLDAWRRDQVTERALKWARDHAEVLRFADNDPLVALYGNKFTQFDGRYNYTGTNRQYPELNAAAIIHFTGTRKPDFEDCPHPAVPQFLQMRERTPWRGLPLKRAKDRRRRSFIGRLFDKAIIFRHRLGLVRS